MTAREWFQKAKSEQFAIGAFNVGNLEIFKAVAEAAVNKKSPVIVESSPGEAAWVGAENIVDLARNFSAEYGIEILVNLDHGQSLEQCREAIELGFDLVHIDGSELPIEKNILLTRQVVELAHPKGILVEGEMDHIGGSSEVHIGMAIIEENKLPLTDPEKARLFVSETGVDTLAVSIGNVHGTFLGGGENIQSGILDRLRTVLPITYFSLHGGSGIPEYQIQEAVCKGIVKVNINTELRQVFKESLEEVLKNSAGEYAMYKLEGPVIGEVREVVEAKIKIFGSAGKLA